MPHTKTEVFDNADIIALRQLGVCKERNGDRGMGKKVGEEAQDKSNVSSAHHPGKIFC